MVVYFASKQCCQKEQVFCLIALDCSHAANHFWGFRWMNNKCILQFVVCCVLAPFMSLRLQSLKPLLKRFRLIFDEWHLFWFKVVSRVVLITIDIWSAITLTRFSYAGLHDTVLFSSLHDSANTSPAGHVTNKVSELCRMIVFNLFCHWDGLKFK